MENSAQKCRYLLISEHNEYSKKFVVKLLSGYNVVANSNFGCKP